MIKEPMVYTIFVHPAASTAYLTPGKMEIEI
jgi:hypothetical protein